MKIIPCLPALLSLLAPAFTHATVTEQQWGEWYGNTGGMEFALSSDNQAGETLTISCSNKKMVVAWQLPKEDYRATSDEGMSEVYLLINNEKYSLENETLLPGEAVPAKVAFEALKQTGAKDKLAFTAFQSGESKPFSASGLHDALKDITWQDCLDQP